ncbi:MAG: nucleoside hydrolase [Rhodospirillales bacterium]|nr:nucleoside hydrolase [Rhodospirillales bacterium]
MTAPRPIIIDCDPGHDDAVAILLALASPETLAVQAITAVAGNVPLPLTQRNARAMVELAGRPDVPVHAGCAEPWLRPLVTAENICGPTGIDGADLSEPALPLAPKHAADAIVELLMAAPDRSATLCPLGPLTNIATALAREPHIAGRIREIVLMGGAIGLGNATPAAEYNFYVDPHAAAAVFAAGVPIVMLPLEATHQALATPAWIEALGQRGTRAAAIVARMLARHLTRDLSRVSGRGVPLHDPCVIAWLLWPELFEDRPCAVAIETTGERTIGRSVVDWWGSTKAPANARVVHRLDADALLARLADRLARLP